MPKKGAADEATLGGARGSVESQEGQGATPGESQFLKATEARTERMRWVTLGLSRNLNQIRWAWERPVKAYDHVSVPMQQVMTLLALVTLFPIEEMVYDLADDEQCTRKIPAWVGPDLNLSNPGGFLANLPQWRRAVALSKVEVYLEPRGRHIAGLRAWLPPYDGTPAWKMELDAPRLADIVHCLMEILPAWGLPPLRVKFPPTPQ
ncbi:hypothetical protein [Deinococcus fonticola]|uniref:hypothetical protein n=1 Tax=Deinococcus fonticola TaxID=2528713 RepID=UPI00107520BA|nr:hypothetical protein [Deinococcus fonticola]